MNCYNIIYIIYYYKFTVNLYRKQEFYFARGFPAPFKMQNASVLAARRGWASFCCQVPLFMLQ